MEGIEPNSGPQTGSTHGNSSLRGRGRGCSGSGHRSQQDPIDDAFADTSVRDPDGLSIK